MTTEHDAWTIYLSECSDEAIKRLHDDADKRGIDVVSAEFNARRDKVALYNARSASAERRAIRKYDDVRYKG